MNLEVIDKKKEKELKKREQILNGNLLKTIFMVAIPLVLYNLCNYLYGVYDTFIVAKTGIGSVDSVVFLDQVKNMIVPLGASIAVGGSIIVSRKFGEGNIESSRRSANTLFWLCLIIALAVIMIFIPFGVPFLKLLGTNQEFIDHSMGYFNIQILSVAVVYINNAFIGIEKAKGNTKRILYLNLIVVALKLILTTIFVKLPNADTSYVAMATLISQSTLMIFGVFVLIQKSNILGISFKFIKHLRWKEISPILIISLPVFLGRFLFSYGKVFILDQATVYGTICIGALGISNSISGSVNNILNSFEDAGSAIISQNLGNKNIKRTFVAYKKLLIISVIIGFVGSVVLIGFGKPIAQFFAPGDALKQEMIQKINFYESLVLCLMGLESASLAILYGYGKTRITMTISILRLFVFRIPPLLLMIYVFEVDYRATGLAMGISNGLSGIFALSMALIVISSIKRQNSYMGIPLNKELF